MLGVKANQVIGLAVVLSGALAAAVAVILTVQTPFVTPDFALQDTIIVLVGRRRRRHRPPLDGHARRLRDRLHLGHRQRRPADRQHRLPALGRVRARDPRAAAAPGRACSCAAAPRWSIAYEPQPRRRASRCSARCCSSSSSGCVSTQVSLANELYFLNAIVVGRDGRRDLRLRRQLGRALVRADQLRRRGRLRRRA